jgi:hypothetical protein
MLNLFLGIFDLVIKFGDMGLFGLVGRLVIYVEEID